MQLINPWSVDNRKDVVNKVVLFLFSPFLGFLYALKKLNTKSSYAIIYAACVVFGLCFTVADMRTDGSADGITFRLRFEDWEFKSEQTYAADLEKYLEFDDGQPDMYFNTVAFVVSRFTGNYHVMFMVLAIVFAFFQLKSLRYFSSSQNYRNSLCCFLLLALFLWNSIFNINGMRFWTAAWVAVFSLFKVLRDNDKKFLLLALITPFIHSAYWAFLLMLVIGVLLMRYTKWWIGAFVVSAIVSSFIFTIIEASSSYLPAFLQAKVDYYTDEEYIERVANPTGTGFYWLEPMFKVISTLYINILAAFLILNIKRISGTYNKRILQFLIVYMTLVNILMPIPSMGVRFIVLAYPIIAYLWIEHMDLQKFKWVIYLFPVAFLMNIRALVLNYLSVTPSDFFYLSPLCLLIKYLL